MLKIEVPNITEEKMANESTLTDLLRTANETLGGDIEVRLSRNDSQITFALPKEKVIWITIIKSVIFIPLVILTVLNIIPYWIFFIASTFSIFFVNTSVYLTFRRTVVDLKQKRIRNYLAFIKIKECSLDDYDRQLVYCLSVNGSSPIPEDFCLVFKEKGKRQEVFLAHIGAKDSARTSANQKVIASICYRILCDCGMEVAEDEAPEIRLIHRNAIFS